MKIMLFFLAFILSRLDSDLAKRNSFAHFSAFRPVAKIGDFLQLNSTSAQDSGEICEVSTTVDKDEENEISSKELDYLYINILYLLLEFSVFRKGHYKKR